MVAICFFKFVVAFDIFVRIDAKNVDIDYNVENMLHVANFRNNYIADEV